MRAPGHSYPSGDPGIERRISPEIRLNLRSYEYVCTVESLLSVPSAPRNIKISKLWN